MIFNIYKKALAVLMKKPLKLWGISLLSVLLCSVLPALCGVAIPVLGLSVSLLLSTSMMMVYLHGYRGEEVQVTQLFDCFKDWATIKRVVLGLSWMMLWIFLWSLIPIAGPILAIIRAYEYRLTPYILITEPDVSITQAIKISSQRTDGYKAKMFGADILLYVILFVAFLILGLLLVIPVLGALIYVVAFIVVAALLPLFVGLVQAAFYEEITNPTPAVQAPAAPVIEGAAPAASNFCPNCGAPYSFEEAKFCTSCGRPKD